MNPLVSVIIPLYNEPVEFARKAIDSIINQTYKNLEIILILDNPDNTVLKNLILEYEKCDARIKPYFNKLNMGLPESLNNGIRMATGEYLARMDGDDISDCKRIEKQMSFLLSHRDIDMVGSDAYAINEDGELIGEYLKLEKDFSQKFMLKHAAINLIHPTWLGKCELFRKCMYRNYQHCEDYDFMIRAYAGGANFYNIKEKLFYVRIQQKSLRSVSRKYAYEQYINTLTLKRQYKEYKKKRMDKFPELPEFVYDEKDKKKYQSTISMLNDLREAYFSKNIYKIIKLTVNIAKVDIRPLKFRLKVFLVYKLLSFMEKLRLV